MHTNHKLSPQAPTIPVQSSITAVRRPAPTIRSRSSQVRSAAASGRFRALARTSYREPRRQNSGWGRGEGVVARGEAHEVRDTRLPCSRAGATRGALRKQRQAAPAAHTCDDACRQAAHS